MPNLETANGPIAELLNVRLMRVFQALNQAPELCRKRQCRRVGRCMGKATLVGPSLLQVNWLPPCLHQAPREFRQQCRALSEEIMDCVRQSEARAAFPRDDAKAERLRNLMATLSAVHRLPGLHLDRERDAIAAWRARDPEPPRASSLPRPDRRRKPTAEKTAPIEGARQTP